MRKPSLIPVGDRQDAPNVSDCVGELRQNHDSLFIDGCAVPMRSGVAEISGFSLMCRFVLYATLTIVSATLLAAEAPPNAAPMELTHGKPFVMVKVNGRGPFRFVIDTGTGAQAILAPELVKQLGLPPAGQVRLRDPSGQNGQSVPTVQIQSLHVAGVDFESVRAVVHTLGDGNGYYEGLLGFTLFRDYLLKLDFPKREMTLSEGALEPDGGHSVMPFRMPDGLPIVSLRVGALHIDAEIDSGGEGLSLPEEFAARLKYLSDPATFGNGQSLSTRFQIKSARLALDVHLGTYTFPRPFVEINGAFPLANFGSCPMQDFAVTFDQKNDLIRFEAGRKIHGLGATPTPIRLVNMPLPLPPDLSLVPVD